MNFCPNCGKELVNNETICASCGTSVAPENNPNYQQGTIYVDPMAQENQFQEMPNQQQFQEMPNQQQFQEMPNQQQYQGIPNQHRYQGTSYGPPPITENMLPAEYKPVSIGAYIGYSILFSIPLIGWIMLFVTAFGSSNSKSLRNFAKAQLILTAISLVFALLYFAFMFLVFGSAMMTEGFMYY